MTDVKRQEELRTKLETFGDPRKTWRWREGDPDYVAALALTPDDVPQLLAVTREWVERTDWPEDDTDLSVYAPIHAWRSLAQLKAVDAVPVLLEMLAPMDERMDDWHLEEFPYAFAWIGPTALDLLTAYLREPSHPEFARICAAHGMQTIAAAHEDQRERVVSGLAGQLEHFSDQPESLNAFLVSYLLQLKAVSAADVIERAFAADAVDVPVVGNWSQVRAELGVQGQGLVPDTLANQRLHPFLPSPPVDASLPSHGSSHPSAPGRDHRRNQRKRERRNRKRGRRK